MTTRLALFGEHTLPACPFRLPAEVRLGSARVSRLPVTRWAVLVATIGLAGAVFVGGACSAGESI